MASTTEEAQTGEKRRQSTRLRRDSTAKKQAVEPEATPVKAEETPKARTAGRPKKEEKPKAGKPRKSLPDVTVVESPAPRIQTLPAKIKDGEPLPTLDHIQKDVGDDYQSMRDSGVLAAALARSRKRWVTDGVLDKYWTKAPPKKRGDTAPRQKPPGERMGPCTLTVEPHIFDITLYLVKENLPPSHPQYHLYAPPPPPQPPQQQYRPPAPQPVPQPRPPPTPAARAPSSTSSTTPQPSQPDPVIHMLAQRASTNPELKSVMKIVATGAANQEQLDYFQKHIDELTRLAKKQQEPKKPPPPVYNQNSFQHQPYHPPQRPVQAAPPPVFRINAVLIEFALDTTSRYLFPPNSILEYGPGFKSCIASFLIKRKVSQAEDIAHYRDCAAALNHAAAKSAAAANIQLPAVDDMVFWQPVTVRFACETGNLLEYLARVVKPPAEVKAWMERALNGAEPELQKPAPAVAPQPVMPAGGSVKVEDAAKPDAAPVVAAADAKIEYPQAAFRADARKLALRLPKEDKGKENEG